LWKRLRNRQLGFHFRRQHPIDHFVLDFYCEEVRLAVEIDGEGHQRWHAQDDAVRDAELSQQEILTLRFSNEQIGGDLANCIETIALACFGRAGRFERPHLAAEDERWHRRNSGSGEGD